MYFQLTDQFFFDFSDQDEKLHHFEQNLSGNTMKQKNLK